MHPTNEPDPDSLHAGLPVLKGIKWAMTKWIRESKTWVWFDGADKATLDNWAAQDEQFAKERAIRLEKYLASEPQPTEIKTNP